jgi:hypothetical protein
MTHMPDLPVSDQVIEHRRVIKFWIERCKELEKENEQLKEKVRSFYG